MKKITCEMCGGNDLLKQEGIFVCQSCGTKYSIEEAKKLMIEGTVEVTGKVKVDNTAKLENLYKVARRAKKDANVEQAFKYYEQIVLEDPDSWEANFYAAYYSGIQKFREGEIGSAASVVENCLDSVFDLIKDIQDDDEQKSAASEVAGKVESFGNALFDDIRKEFQLHVPPGTENFSIHAHHRNKKYANEARVNAMTRALEKALERRLNKEDIETLEEEEVGDIPPAPALATSIFPMF